MPQVGVPSSWQNSFGAWPTFAGMTLGPAARNLKVGWNFEDFISPMATGMHGVWFMSALGAGAYGMTSSSSDGTRVGIAQSATGTTATGRGGMYAGGVNLNSIRFSAGEYIYETEIVIGALSTAIEEYYLYHGFGDLMTGEPVDGAYFSYDRAVSGANWFCKTSDNGVRTSVDSGVAVDTNYHKFKIVVNPTGTSVAFYVDGTLVATIVTNIPVGGARQVGLLQNIIKTVGLTTRFFSVDWVWFWYDLTVSR